MRILPIVAACLLPAFLTGCGVFGSAGPTGLQSADGSARLPLNATQAVYASSDANSADIYLTDLDPLDRLEGADLTGVSGQFVHLRVFFTPEAGRTPIDETAFNVAVRYIVVAGNDIGFYGGGGFIFLSDEPGDSELSGAVRRATLRLISATPAFDDRLGSAEFWGSISANKDQAAAEKMSGEFDDFLRRTQAK